MNIDYIYNEIEQLKCLRQMVEYYQYIYESIEHLLGQKKPVSDLSITKEKTISNSSLNKSEIPSEKVNVEKYIEKIIEETKGQKFDYNFTRLSREMVLECRRFINSDLHNLSIEFYLQRANWAMKCREELSAEKTKNDSINAHQIDAKMNPARHPCQMRGGFRKIVDSGENAYTYEKFLGETQSIFIAIHSHLVSINRVLGDLYHHVTETPFSAFTSSGKSEIRHLSSELNRIMRGLLVATHLQPQDEWQYDLVSYLITCRADCQRFFETIPRYYQTHRMRLIIFSDDSMKGNNDSDVYPLSCLPWSAGTYLDFLMAYQSMALHTLAVLHWSIRLYSRWYIVPDRYLHLVSPSFIGIRL